MNFEQTDEQIIHQIKQGRHELFKRLVEKYSLPLFIFASNMMNNAHQVEDIVQDTFLAAFKNIRIYSPEKASFTTWLFTIAKNRCLNDLKKRKEDNMMDMSHIASRDNTTQALNEKELFSRLDKALSELSVNEKSIFILAELQEFTYEEISRIENIKIGTVKSKLSRTKQKLRNILEKTYKGPANED